MAEWHGRFGAGDVIDRGMRTLKVYLSSNEVHRGAGAEIPHDRSVY